MPERDGYDFIRDMRAMPGAAGRVPAIALTALARDEDRKRTLLAGYQVHISKPVDPAELVTVIATLAGRGKISQQPRAALFMRTGYGRAHGDFARIAAFQSLTMLA